MHFAICLYSINHQIGRENKQDILDFRSSAAVLNYNEECPFYLVPSHSLVTHESREAQITRRILLGIKALAFFFPDFQLNVCRLNY